MNQERRGASLETVLVEIGYIKGKLDELSAGQKLQNGRVKKLEIWQAGVIAIVCFISIVVLPVFTKVTGELLLNGYGKLHQASNGYGNNVTELSKQAMANETPDKV